MRVCLMIEGQEDVTWEQWLALAGACEEHGLEGMFRSDHYESVMGMRERGSLDAWATLAALAARTRRIRLGTLVSPATFRHPSVLAKMVATVDHVSGGRAELGLGAGWHEGEHRAYGFEFPPTPTRMERLAEQLEIVTRSWTEDAVEFQGRHYQVQDLRALPKPVQRPRPTLLVGGGAGPKSLALAARFADEYNTVAVPLEDLPERRRRQLDAWRDAGRDPETARLSLMTTCVVGRDRAEVEERVRRVLAVTGGDGSADEVMDQRPGWLLGTTDQMVEQLRALEAAGISRVMLQHLDHADLDMVAVLGEVAATMGAAPS
jgi:F420-dependent oxidoreductase-like protein